MEIRSEQLDDQTLKITLTGRMDIPGTEAIDLRFTALTATRKAAVLVDLSGVSFLSSIGMRTLLSNAKALKARGGKMVLFDPQPMVAEVLTVSGVASLIPIFTDLTHALQALSATPPT
jgi:anti-sigma B factor antagonist